MGDPTPVPPAGPTQGPESPAAEPVAEQPPAVAAPRSERSPRWWHHRIPLLVVTACVIAVSVPNLLRVVYQESSGDFPWPVVTVAVWLVYALPLLWIIMHLDYFEPEPPLTVGAALAWGALVATGMVFSLNADLRALIAALFGQHFESDWAGAIVAPMTEELAKALGVFVVLLLSTRRPLTPLAGLVTGALVGLGFQVAENLVYTLRAAPELGELPAILRMLHVRGLVGGLWSHALYGAVAGYGVGYAMVRTHVGWWRRLAVFAGCLLAAAGLHSLWNAPVLARPLVDTDSPGQIVKGLAALCFFLGILAAGQRREAALYLPYLDSPFGGRGMATGTELADLGSTARRQRARWRAARRVPRGRGLPHRVEAWVALGALQRAQADAAVALAHERWSDLRMARGQAHAARVRLRRVGALVPVGVARMPGTGPALGLAEESSAVGTPGGAAPEVVILPIPAAEPVPPAHGTPRGPRSGQRTAFAAMVLAVFGVFELWIALLALVAALAARRMAGPTPGRQVAVSTRTALWVAWLSVAISGVLTLRLWMGP